MSSSDTTNDGDLSTQCGGVSVTDECTHEENMEKFRRNQNSTNSWVVQYFVLGMYIRGQGSELFHYCELDMVDKVKRMLKNRFSKRFKFSVAFFCVLS